MAQTTGHTTLRNMQIEISTDNNTWTDISGESNSIDLSGGEISTGEEYTAEGELPLVGIGKKSLTEAKVKVVYVEGNSSAWQTFFDAYSDGTEIYLRYAPKGNAEGNNRFTSGKGFVTSPVYPKGSVAEAKPVMCELSFKCPGFTLDQIPAPGP
jgi:hypothetical protein